MSAPRFHCPAPLVAGDTIALPPATFHHAVRVRRLRVGEALVLFAGDGLEVDATLSLIRRDGADALLATPVAVDRESPLDVTLLQGISSGDRMDYTLQKAAELGVRRIVPVVTERSQRLTDARADKRAAHWQQVVVSACEQSGRNRIPAVDAVVAMRDALALTNEATGLLLSCADGVQLRAVSRPAGAIALLAGPEGGLSDDEERAARDAGYAGVTLGPRILRTETAAIAALAAMQALWGDG